MFKTIEGNFENSDVNELLKKHFIELRAASPEGSAHVLDIEGLKVPSIKFWSLWDDDKLIGRPTNFSVTVREIEIAAGAQFIIPILGKMMRMPGLPGKPASEGMSIDNNGVISGLS